jgi:hypothetical protein
MKLQELIEEYLTEGDLIDVLCSLNLNHTGSKRELFEKVLNGIEGKSAKEVLSLLSSDALIRIYKAKDIKQDWPFFSDSNEQMVKKIYSRVLDKDGPEFASNRLKNQVEPPNIIKEAQREPDQPSLSKPEIKAASPPSRVDSGFEAVVRDIEGWSPRSNYKSEDGYRDDLNPWLWSRSHHTTIRKSDATVDVLVDNKYPIMIIIEPTLSDFHRAFGQIHRHLEKFQSVILVICRPKQDGELEFFEKRVRRSLTYSKYPYKIIKKN